jgi:hypothetical protein
MIAAFAAGLGGLRHRILQGVLTPPDDNDRCPFDGEPQR